MPKGQRPKYVIGPDHVLAEEVFILKDGRRLTNELADQIVEETLAEARRRNLIPDGKSMSGGGAHSPRVQFQVPQDLHEQAERVAEDEGLSVSAVARHAVERYLRSRASSVCSAPPSGTNRGAFCSPGDQNAPRSTRAEGQICAKMYE